MQKSESISTEGQRGQEKQENSSKNIRFWIALLLTSCLFFTLLYMGWIFLQKPAIGDIRTSTVVSRKDSDSKREMEQYAGEYLTFSYPTVYREKAHTIPVKGPVKESIFLSTNSLEERKIALVVEERAEGAFEGSPSFKIRLNKPQEYKKEHISIGGYEGVLFKKNTAVFERTFFFHEANFVITAATTSSMNAEALETELAVIIESLRFLK